MDLDPSPSLDEPPTKMGGPKFRDLSTVGGLSQDSLGCPIGSLNMDSLDNVQPTPDEPPTGAPEGPEPPGEKPTGSEGDTTPENKGPRNDVTGSENLAAKDQVAKIPGVKDQVLKILTVKDRKDKVVKNLEQNQ